MPVDSPIGDGPLPTAVDSEIAYRNHIADLILDYATDQRTLDNPDAYRRVIALTGKTLGTVKNWLSYRTNLPDLASLARIIEHWSIPTSSIFPSQLPTLLPGVPLHASSSQQGSAFGNSAEQVVLSLHGRGDNKRVDAALSTYTNNPTRAVLLRQESSDMLDDIRPGELMLVDSSCEQVRESGIYLLRFDNIDDGRRVHTRFVDVLVSRPAVRIRGGSSSASSGSEEIPSSSTGLAGVTVLGRIVGVLRQV